MTPIVLRLPWGSPGPLAPADLERIPEWLDDLYEAERLATAPTFAELCRMGLRADPYHARVKRGAR